MNEAFIPIKYYAKDLTTIYIRSQSTKNLVKSWDINALQKAVYQTQYATNII